MAITKVPRSVVVVLGAAAAASVVYVLWGVDRGAPAGHRLRPDDATLVALGQRVYREHCAACHGMRLEGQANWRERGPDGKLPAPPHDASGHTWHHPDELLFQIAKHGVAKAAKLTDYATAMPVYEGVLSDEEIVAVLSWIKSQWPAHIRSRHDELNRSAAR